MKRLHVHVAVNDLDQSIGFYSALFAAQPSVVKSDYAKWMLDDPHVNFAISARGREAGLDHLGIQVEDAAELQEVYARLRAAGQLDQPQPFVGDGLGLLDGGGLAHLEVGCAAERPGTAQAGCERLARLACGLSWPTCQT